MVRRSRLRSSKILTTKDDHGCQIIFMLCIAVISIPLFCYYFSATDKLTQDRNHSERFIEGFTIQDEEVHEEARSSLIEVREYALLQPPVAHYKMNIYQAGSNTTYTNSLRFAQSRGGRLPTIIEVIEYLASYCNQPLFDEDVWWPVADGFNAWISVGSFNPSKRLGKTHFEMFNKNPDWGDVNVSCRWKQSLALIENVDLPPPAVALARLNSSNCSSSIENCPLLPLARSANCLPKSNPLVPPPSCAKVLLTSVYEENNELRRRELEEVCNICMQARTTLFTLCQGAPAQLASLRPRAPDLQPTWPVP
jgi:hypothetical protein